MGLCFLAGIAALIAAIIYRKDKKDKRCQCGGKVPNQRHPNLYDTYEYRDRPGPNSNEKGFNSRDSVAAPPEYDQGGAGNTVGDYKMQYREAAVGEEMVERSYYDGPYPKYEKA